MSELRERGALSNTAVVVCEEGQPLGHQYAAMCCACSIGGERRGAGACRGGSAPGPPLQFYLRVWDSALAAVRVQGQRPEGSVPALSVYSILRFLCVLAAVTRRCGIDTSHPDALLRWHLGMHWGHCGLHCVLQHAHWGSM